MANSINTLKDAPGVIAKLGAEMLANKTAFCQSIDKADASDFDGKNGFQAGDTIYVNKPARFIPSSSADISSDIQDIAEEKVALSLDTRKVVAIELTSAEIATELDLKKWSKRVLEPAVSSLAQHIEKDFLETAIDATSNAGGTPGSTTFDTSTVLTANARIDQNACLDRDNRTIMLNPLAQVSAVNARKGLFQSASEIGDQYRSGLMGRADGFDFVSSSLLPTHTNGNDVAFEVRTTVSTEGQTTLVVEGLTTTTGTVTKGTVFTIDTVYAVNPITKETETHLKQFVVAADATADGSGYATLTLTEGFYTSASGGLQNVSAFPADGDTITPIGSASTGYGQNLAFHKNAFRMVSVPLVKPDGTHMASQETVDGMTLRVVQDYNISSDKMIMRLDFLGGIAAVRPEWAYRIYS